MNVLVISAHPDDETLGCGGALLRHKAVGDRLFWIIATQAHGSQWSAKVIKRKEQEVNRVSKAYGVEKYFRLKFPTTKLDKIPQADLIDRIRAAISKVKPELVYLVHGGDIHSDHSAVFRAATSVLKPFYMSGLGVHKILCYETLSSTDAAPPLSDRTFVPHVFTNITNYIERKIKIMKLYQTEVQNDPLPRGPSAIRALARYRGATIGVDYAEAFMLIRELI